MKTLTDFLDDLPRDPDFEEHLRGTGARIAAAERLANATPAELREALDRRPELEGQAETLRRYIEGLAHHLSLLEARLWRRLYLAKRRDPQGDLSEWEPEGHA